ncbi:MAG: rhamnulokinase [Acidobacteria bacterium]|nr:rhamnulokinase [Acidobacteriota bacterium]
MRVSADFLAFDIGAESGRAMLGRLAGGRLSLDELARFSNLPRRIDGSLRWDFDAIWQAVREGLAAAVARGVSPVSIGVDAWGVDYGLIDAEGDLVEPPYHYRDHRTDGMVDRVSALIGRARLYETTGVQCLAINTIYQLRAAVEQTPAVIERAERLLTIPDLVNYRLTGRAACEFTNASTTQCVNARTRRWATDILRDLEIPPRLFGEIVEPGTVLGPLAAHASVELAGTPVVAPACHDTGSAVAAVRTGGGTAFLSSGTWSLLGIEVPAPALTEEARELNFTNEGGVAGTTRLLKNIAGLWLLQACRQRWAAGSAAPAYEDLVAAARDAPPIRTIVDVDDPVFLNPDDMPAAIAAYARRTGQPVPDCPAAFTRCIFESFARKYREVTDAIERLAGQRIHTIRVVGGGAKNALLTQLTADATGRTVLAGPVEATALGNIAVQMVATGHATSIDEARGIIERSWPADRYEPRETEPGRR